MKNMQSEDVTCAPPETALESVVDAVEENAAEAESDIESLSESDEEEDAVAADENNPDTAAISQTADHIMQYMNAAKWLDNGGPEEFIIQSLEYLDGMDILTYIEIFEDDDDGTYNYYMYITSIVRFFVAKH